MTPRDFAIHRARVYLVEARRSRHWHRWHATLMQWVANARREAAQGQKELPW